MARTLRMWPGLDALLAVALRGEWDEAQSRELYRYGPEAVAPTKTITAALKTYLQTGQLPPLPANSTANG